MQVRNFRELVVWKLGIEIVSDVYRLTRLFPKEELFGLTSQMRRASVSIPSNIAEGFNRRSRKDFARFLYIASGSCAELETQVEISFRMKFMEQKDSQGLIEKMNHEEKMLTSLISKFNEGPGTRDEERR